MCKKELVKGMKELEVGVCFYKSQEVWGDTRQLNSSFWAQFSFRKWFGLNLVLLVEQEYFVSEIENPFYKTETEVSEAL